MAKRLTKEAKAARSIKSSARKRGLKGEAFNKYVYGTLQHIGLLKGNKKTARGKSPAHRRRRR